MDQQALPEIEGQQTFKNILEVVSFLKGQEWKISKSTIYRHRDEGRLRPAKDGSYSVKAVEKYVRDFLQKKDGSGKSTAKAVPSMQEKQFAETRKIAAQADHWELKAGQLRGDLIDRSIVVGLLARRLMELKTSLENFLPSFMGELCGILNGDPKLIPDAIEFGLNKLYKILDNYGRNPNLEIPKKEKLEK